MSLENATSTEKSNASWKEPVLEERNSYGSVRFSFLGGGRGISIPVMETKSKALEQTLERGDEASRWSEGIQAGATV